MKYYFLKFILLCFYLISPFFYGPIFGQTLSIEKIKDSIQKETSYYDILKYKNDKYYVCGKNGILASIQNDTTELLCQFPEHLYKMIQMNDSIILVCANKGNLYYYNLLQKTFTTKYIPKLHYACVYEACMINDTCILICGGASPIALGKKTLPRGFVYQSNNSGNSWKKVYAKKSRFVWDIEVNQNSKNIELLTYAPWGSKIVAKDFNFKQRKIILKSKKLLHQACNQNTCLYNGGKFKSNQGFITQNNQMQNTTFCWSAFYTSNYLLGTHSGGTLSLLKNNEAIQIFKTPSKNNLYEIAQINDKQFYVVGSNNTILKVTVQE